jgi:hypothetical protein
MSKISNGSKAVPTQKPAGYKLGWRASTHISKVEGQVMSREMQGMFVGFDKADMTPEQRRKALREKYGKPV